eukprot:scaffold36277_cov117-Isochrysis_galbana.AAC.3
MGVARPVVTGRPRPHAWAGQRRKVGRRRSSAAHMQVILGAPDDEGNYGAGWRADEHSPVNSSIEPKIYTTGPAGATATQQCPSLSACRLRPSWHWLRAQCWHRRGRLQRRSSPPQWSPTGPSLSPALPGTATIAINPTSATRTRS